jgi:N-acyl-D-aspartate/D-glutamate deacylase
MCDPISIGAATFLVGAGQTISSYLGQQAAYKENKVAANLNYANQHDILEQRRVQLDQQKSENALDTAIATVRAQGEVAAAAGSMGLSSSSIVQALNADMFGIGRQAMAEDTNDQNQRIQLSNELRGAEISRVSQIGKVTKPGLLDLGLGLAGDALKGVGSYSNAGGKF